LPNPQFPNLGLPILSHIALAGVLLGIACLAAAKPAWSGPATAQLAALDQDGGAGDAAQGDVPWSAVVRDIQRELRDLGLYEGPLDGRYDARVKDAIRRFERQHGEIGEGAPLADALHRIISVRDALNLRRNLNEARERQTEQALRALRGSPATRDLIDGGKPSGSAPGAGCADAVSIDCLLAEARRAAAGVDQANFKDWALREIILTEVRTRRDDAVRDRLRRLSDPRLVLVAMREVAEALAESGRTSEALDLAGTVPDAENRIRAFASIAVSAARQGDSTQSRSLAQRVIVQLGEQNGMAARVAIATTLASGLAQAGDMEAATDVIRAARDFASAATARLIHHAELGMITGALADTGEYSAAVDALTALAEDSSTAMMAASASAVSRAAFAEGDRYRVATLCNLAVVHAKAGKQKAAADTLVKAGAVATRLRNGYPQAYARFSLAQAWARVGGFDKAEAQLADLDHGALQAEGYWRVAEIAAEAGQGKRADAFEQRALAIAGGIDSRYDRAMMLSDMAVAAARAKRAPAARRIFEEALTAGRGLEEGWWRARALARLATALHAVTGAEASR
jgi:peptidoglycan hydrolase-like protein with peptidoglycan-binding domain